MVNELDLPSILMAGLPDPGTQTEYFEQPVLMKHQSLSNAFHKRPERTRHRPLLAGENHYRDLESCLREYRHVRRLQGWIDGELDEPLELVMQRPHLLEQAGPRMLVLRVR